MANHNGDAPADDAGASEPSSPLSAPAWFEEIYNDLFRDLVKGVMALGGSIAEAEDAAEEAMLELLKRVNTGREVTNVRGWTRKAARRCFIRRRKRDRSLLQRLIAARPAVFDCRSQLDLICWEDKQWADQVLDHLSPTQRAVMERAAEGLSPAEIGELLGKTPANVRKNLQLARDRLKPLLSGASSPREEDTQ
ncbi:sigma-70 family RNA polymerase sigma factor [Actinomadura napierensis]|uniref:Sigma-70 family RNA polymerase sigma factor n=1 Tax=Actinomadura napierensis TaxID=267854 RepID=A0ABN3AF84_9ACTN